LFGTSCDGTPYSWCSEWDLGGRYLATMPGKQTTSGESYAGNWSNGGNWVVTIKVGHSRIDTCGF
jgi:hypothetical protein